MVQPAVPFDVRPGDVLVGKYRVERLLGAGGMGVVLAARHMQLDAPVAIKMLHSGLLESRDAVQRFEREARAAARVTNEHVARVFDVGTLPSGMPYMVMELLEGCDLGKLLTERGPLPVGEAVDFLLQACAALQEAHALGIIHRDLKPSNLFCIQRDGQPFIKVLDFGISKLVDGGADGTAATQTSALLGTPFYMSPEQMRSTKDVTAQTDIWSLGVVLHELLTGAPPFVGETLPEICVRIATEAPPPVRAARPDVSPGLEAVISRCLERDRSIRFASAGELAAALLEFAPASRAPMGRPVAAGLAAQGAFGPDPRSVRPPRAHGTGMGTTAVATTTSTVSFGHIPRAGSRAVAVIAALGLSIIALVAVGLTLRHSIGGSGAPAPAAPAAMAIASSGSPASSVSGAAPSAPAAAAPEATLNVASGRAPPEALDVAPPPRPDPSPAATASSFRPRPAPARAKSRAATASPAAGPTTAPLAAPATTTPPPAPSPRPTAAKADDAYEHM